MRHIQNGPGNAGKLPGIRRISRKTCYYPDKDWPLPCSITPMFQERDGISEKTHCKVL